MEERLRRLELRRMARRRRFRLISIILLILAGGMATNVYLAFRPVHVRDVVQRSLRRYFGEDVRFASGIDVDLTDGIQVHHLRFESDVDLSGSDDGTGGGLTSTTLTIRRILLVPRLGDLLIGRLKVARAVVDAPVLSVHCVGDQCDDIGSRVRRLTRILMKSRGGDRQHPRLEIRGGEILYEGNSPAGERSRYRLFNIDGRVRALASGEVQLDLTGQSPYLESIAVWARQSPDGSQNVRFELERVDLAALAPHVTHPALRAFLPDDDIDRLDLQGAVNLLGEIRLAADAESEVDILQLSGRFAGVHVRHADLALPFEDLEGAFSFVDDRLSLERVNGRLGGGAMRAHGTLQLSPDLATVISLEGRLSAEAVPADRRVFPGSESKLREHLDRIRLNGTFGIELELEKTEFPLGPSSIDDVRVEISFEHLGVLHQSFPLALEDVAGTLVVEKGEVTIASPITGRHAHGALSVKGRLALDPTGAVDVVVGLENVRLGERLRNALPTEAVSLWDELRPSGHADLRFNLKRESGAGEFSSLLLNADLRDVSCVAQRFPCEFSGVSGGMTVDLLGRRIEFDNLEGKHNGEPSSVVGYFEYADQGVFLARITTPQLTIGPDIRTALPADLGRIVEEFALSGTVGSVVTIDNRRTGALEAHGEVTIEDLKVSYVHFPYPLHLRSGSLEIDRQGRLTLRELKTDDAATPQVALSGTLHTIGSARVLDYAVDVERLDVDETFVAALPDDTRRFVNGLGLGGRFAGRFEGRFSYDVDRPSQSRSVYRAKHVRTENASIEFGPRLYDIVASGQFEGRRGLAEKHRFTGSLRVESTSFNRVRMKNSDVQFSLGEDLPALVDLRHGVAHDEGGFEPSPALLERLRGEQIEDSFQVHVRSSKLYGGDLEGFFYIDIGTRHDFGGEFMGRGVQVALASEDVFGEPGEGLSGEAEGVVTFSGTTGDLASMTGKGEGRIESAEIGSLPVILSIVSWMKGRLTVDPRLRQVLLRFTIEDLAFVCAQPDGLSIDGDGIHLKGGGTMDFDGELALRLIPSVIKSKIPVLDLVIDLFKKVLLPVWIEGPLEDAKVKFSALRVPVGSSGDGTKSEDTEEEKDAPKDLPKDE